MRKPMTSHRIATLYVARRLIRSATRHLPQVSPELES